MRLHVITPIVNCASRTREEFGAVLDASVQLSAEVLPQGPASIEDEVSEAQAVPHVIQRAIAAEQRGVDAIVIDCFGDPGVEAARRQVGIPVIGPGEASMHLAATLGRRFGVVTVLPSVFEMLGHLADRCALRSRLGSIRSVDIPVLELESDLERLNAALVREAIKAVRFDDVDVILLGCTGMLGSAGAVARALRAEFGAEIPVIDPLLAATALAIGTARMHLCHRRRSSPQR